MAINFNSSAAQTDTFKSDVKNSIEGSADDAYEKMLAKKAEYEAAKKQLSVFSDTKNTALKKYTREKEHSKNGQQSSLLGETKSNYESALSQYNSSNMDVDILRSSLMDSIFYSGKMNNSATLANSVLG